MGNRKKKTGRLFVLAVQLILLTFFFLLFVCDFFCCFLQLYRQKVKTVGTQGKAQQHLDLIYSHFHGPSSTREKSAVLPFLPLVTCKQLSRTSNYVAKAPSFTNCQWLGAEKPLLHDIQAIDLGAEFTVWIPNIETHVISYTDTMIQWCCLHVNVVCQLQDYMKTRIIIVFIRIDHVFYGFSAQPNYNTQLSK